MHSHSCTFFQHSLSGCLTRWDGGLPYLRRFVKHLNFMPDPWSSCFLFVLSGSGFITSWICLASGDFLSHLQLNLCTLWHCHAALVSDYGGQPLCDLGNWMTNMTDRAWSAERPSCPDLSHTALTLDGPIARHIARLFDSKAGAAPRPSDDRCIFKACANLMRATGTAKKMAAITGHWWALRVEVTPSWLGSRLANTLRQITWEQVQGLASGPHQSQEDDEDNQELRGLFHSTWQTHTIPPPGPSLATDGDMEYIDFTPWIGRIDWQRFTPPTLATLVLRVEGDAGNDSSIQVLGALFSPPTLRMPTEAQLVILSPFGGTRPYASRTGPSPGRHDGPYGPSPGVPSWRFWHHRTGDYAGNDDVPVTPQAPAQLEGSDWDANDTWYGSDQGTGTQW